MKLPGKSDKINVLSYSFLLYSTDSIALLIDIREALGSVYIWRSGTLTESCGFSLFVREDAGIVP